MRRRAAVYGATSHAVLVTALADTLAAVSPAPALGRRVFTRIPLHPDVGRLVGYFATVHPVVVNLEPVAFAERARTASETARPWQLPDAAGNDSGSEYDVIVTILTDPGPERVAGFGTLVRVEPTTPPSVLDLRAVEADGCLRVYWACSDLPSCAHLAAVGAAYETHLAELADSDRPWWAERFDPAADFPWADEV
jgi:hypothetical protein